MALSTVDQITKLRQENQKLQADKQQLLKANQRLTYEVNHDSLTQLYNRRYFDIHSEQACETASLERKPLSLLVIDIDHFKHFNDTHSHGAGDQLLQQVGQCMFSIAQQSGSWVARYGGEEFVAILPNHDQTEAMAIARLFQKAVRNLGVTVSIGIACYGRDGKTTRELFDRADSRMYFAKKQGRNRIVASEKLQSSMDEHCSISLTSRYMSYIERISAVLNSLLSSPQLSCK